MSPLVSGGIALGGVPFGITTSGSVNRSPWSAVRSTFRLASGLEVPQLGNVKRPASRAANFVAKSTGTSSGLGLCTTNPFLTPADERGGALAASGIATQAKSMPALVGNDTRGRTEVLGVKNAAIMPAKAARASPKT